MPTTSRIAPRRRAPAAARCGRGAPQRAHVFVKEPAPARGGVTIVGGAGRVGAALAHTLLATVPAVTRLVLVDIDTRAAAAQAADLAHAAVLLRSPATVAAGLEASAGCDVLVLCAGAAQATPGESRLMLAGRNTAVCRSALPPAAALSPDAVLVVVTNPCDIVASVAASLLPGWPPGRVLGSGTVLDSARLAFELASASAVSPLSVAAPVLGEHGDSSVALWGAAAVGCLPAAAAVPPPSLDAMACRMRTAGCARRLALPVPSASQPAGRLMHHLASFPQGPHHPGQGPHLLGHCGRRRGSGGNGAVRRADGAHRVCAVSAPCGCGTGVPRAAA